MKQGITITVSELGPIKGPCSVELNNFMIFSGQSGLGKSYLAMLVHYLYRIMVGIDLLDFFDYKKIDYTKLRQAHPNDTEFTLCEISTAELLEWINSRAVKYLQELTGNPELSPVIDIRMEGLPETLTFTSYKAELPATPNTVPEVMEFIRLEESGDKMEIRISFAAMGNVSFIILLNRLFRKLYGVFPSAHFFLPPSRGGILTLPSSAIFNNRDSMGMYYEFLSDFERIKSRLYGVIKPTPPEIKDFLHSKILNGEIRIDSGDTLVYKMNRAAGNAIPISAAAASIKELAPLALMVDKDVASNYSILFEEPESHLHPEMQIAVVDLIVAMTIAGAHFQITTHSDYILRRINDLIYLFAVRQKMGEEAFAKYCAEEGLGTPPLLNPMLVNAYYFHTDADGNTLMTRQDLSNGVPFDTFFNVINTSIYKSSDIYDKFETLTQEETDSPYEDAD